MVVTETKDSKTMMTGGVDSEVAMVKITGGVQSGVDVEFAKCECCGLTEECTKEYIIRVMDRHKGRWICGLCAEAIKDDIVRHGIDEALNRHMNFCNKFKSSSPPRNPTEDLISAVKQLLLRTLDSPRSSRMKKRVNSMYATDSSSSVSSLPRSKSSCSTLNGQTNVHS